MTHEFKPGDRAYLPVVVVDAEPDRNGEIKVTGGRGRGDYWNFIVPAKLVRAIPTPDPLTELERRVVETAIQHQKVWLKFNKSKALRSELTAASEAVDNALNALIATEPLLTPLQELEAFVQHAVDKNEFISTCELLKMVKNISSQRNTTP